MKGIHCHFCKRSTFGSHICIMQASLHYSVLTSFHLPIVWEKVATIFPSIQASGKLQRGISLSEILFTGWLAAGWWLKDHWHPLSGRCYAGNGGNGDDCDDLVLKQFLVVTMRGQVEIWSCAFKGGTDGKISQIRKYPRPTINNPCQDRMDGIGGQRGQVDSAVPPPIPNTHPGVCCLLYSHLCPLMAAYNRPLQRPTASSTENTGKIVNLKKIQIKWL